MPNGNLVGSIDVAELCFWAFVLFFLVLVVYLRREDRREGYPKEDAVSGRVDSAFGPLTASTAKTFQLPFDRGTVSTPTKGREPVEIAARRIDRFPGAPYAPTGDPMTSGVGPGAWAERARYPDVDMHGNPRIVPIGAAATFAVDRRDPDPRGMTVTGADGRVAGTVSDLWVDRSEPIIRYLEITLEGGKQVLAPMPMAKVSRRRGGGIHIDAITAAQFAGVPGLETPGQISRYEEDRVAAYYGGGYLYATPQRQEPWL